MLGRAVRISRAVRIGRAVMDQAGVWGAGCRDVEIMYPSWHTHGIFMAYSWHDQVSQSGMQQPTCVKDINPCLDMHNATVKCTNKKYTV